MRIAYFSDNFYPELSGITDTILISGKELTKRGHDVLYIGPRYSEADYKLGKRPTPKSDAEDTIDGMRAVRLPSFHIPSPTGQSRFAIPSGASFKHLDAFKPDIIHTQSPYGAGYEALRARKRYRVPLVGTNHTAIEDFFPLGFVMRRFDAWYYNHCDFVTTPYQTLIERMRAAGFTKPARALANPAKLNDFIPAVPGERETLKRRFDLKGPVVLYVGRLGVEKRVDVVVRALPTLKIRYPNLTLVMTGHGSAERGLHTLAKKLGVEENVRFVGFLDHHALIDIYKTADVFAFMSTSDSQSISLMQAYAAGVPAVCARARGLPDYTPRECGFLVEPGDDRALAERIMLLLSDAALRERMGAAARNFVKQFSPSNIAQEWEKVYTQVRENK
jgi:1,2-diacylglycerol 3-alpha-glucosyltransferase